MYLQCLGSHFTAMANNSSQRSARAPFWQHFSYLVPCYTLIFISLSTFSVLSMLYLYNPSPLERNAHIEITTPNITARQVACSFPRSGQYGQTQRVIYYILLIGTILLTVALREEQGRWLAIGAATSSMLYSGIAAVHQILIFCYAQKIKPPKRKTCDYIPLGLGYPDLPVCYGADDLDRDSVCLIVGAALLAALPMTAWSKLFRKGSSRREA